MTRASDDRMSMGLNPKELHESSKRMSTLSSELCDQYDLVMVFPLKKECQITQRTRQTHEAIIAAGLETFCYYSIQKDELLVLVRCPLKKMQAFASEVCDL